MNRFWLVSALCCVANTGWAGDSAQAVGGIVNAGNRVTESGGRPVKVLRQANSARGAMQTVGQASGASVPLSVGAAVSVGVLVSVGASQGGGGSVQPGGVSGVIPAAPNGKPLEITNETITVQPPNEALQKKPDTQLEGKPDKTTPAP